MLFGLIRGRVSTLEYVGHSDVSRFTLAPRERRASTPSEQAAYERTRRRIGQIRQIGMSVDLPRALIRLVRVFNVLVVLELLRPQTTLATAVTTVFIP